MNLKQYGVSPNMEKEVSYRFIAHLTGLLLAFESMLLLACCCVSMIYGERDLMSFVISFAVCLSVSAILLIYGRRKKCAMSRNEGYIVVALSWVFFSVFGMVPYLWGGFIPNITDAFFETMSGFTTTGATILDNIESMPHGILFWRSLTQWIGGLGIVCFTIVLLPGFGASSQMLYLSEATGVTHNKLCPKTRVMARYIFMVYILLTAVESALLMAGGMGLFDAVCHSMTTTATGGFSTKQASIAYWHSPYIEYVVSLFMLLSAINFSLYIVACKSKWKQLRKNTELKWFACSVGLLTLVISVVLFLNNGYGVEEAFRKSLFQVATCHTSCGFATDDYNLWPPFTWMLLIFAMLSGGCTGSTSGGVKNLRLIIIANCIRNQFRQILHPRAVLPVRAGFPFDNKLVTTVLVFFAAYLSVAFIGWTLLMAFGVDFTEAMSTVISAMGNVGPGLGSFGPAFSWAALPDAAKWILSSLMLIGRLEIFGFLLIFYRSTWKGSWS
ncbi:MAG: TrkH family potassium uptake protein [Prevotella sp.]|uniref:TrkH family potassium uptake protein n=1 Tax=Prevotella sp. P3-122 TaxID=2024223 RepID=UPI000B95FDE5|nr:TrkH family potassium uptake protein [Prevotella sp. P3-122]MCI6310646.1 TrkH family potassium uptake protein [Prevotella sp.]MCI6501316.1 TrkH family potassium uptake protein [Prevotella sp.]MCI6555741.1 TrkH family potassium uptake protein [Prevotella sp.]MCI7341655.1 TrkH family potassium uptake protein [Prevotella sp.]MCI7360796.1 TrkH family potassium uptake protein [Prevotella sp.]